MRNWLKLTAWVDVEWEDEAGDPRAPDEDAIADAAEVKQLRSSTAAINYVKYDYEHIVDIAISAATVNEKLATIINAGQNMEARKRQRQQRALACPPNLNSYNPGDPQHATRPNVVCRRTPMDVNDITITELEHVRPVTLIVSDIQNYINNINAIELTDPGPCAWGHCLSEFPHFTPVVTTDYFPKFVARPGAYAFRIHTHGQPGVGMGYEHDGPWSWTDYGKWRESPAALRARAMGFTLDELPTSHLSEAALRNLLGGVIDLNVMRNYIKAVVSGVATAPPVIVVCHISNGNSINSDGGHGDYYPTLMASAIAAVVRPYSAQMAALALQSPTVRVSKAPRNYSEAISSNHPMIAIIIQTAWAFAEKHDKDGNLVKRKARVVFRGDQLTAGENYDDTKTYAPVAWKLVKALYGLPQAPKACLSSFLRDFGFISSECDPGVWTLLAADGYLLAILCVYVDESMLATSPSSNIQGRFQTSFFTTFDATTDGLCTWLLGMAIDRKPRGVIHLHQEKYINEIGTTFNMTECKPCRLPCTPDTVFHDPTGAPLDTKLFPYPNLVGSVIWLAVASRPDNAFVVGRLCAYMASPTERHWQIAISVLRYLKGTPSHGLIFRKQLDNGAPNFIFFVDADWATFMPKRRSTTGYLALVHGTPVPYTARKFRRAWPCLLPRRSSWRST
eukprot:jgi/Tetstr1/423309/TSEL_014007.t1